MPATRRPFQCGVFCQAAPSRNGGRPDFFPAPAKGRRSSRDKKSYRPAILLFVSAARESARF
jgi:hypothetical protein